MSASVDSAELLTTVVSANAIRVKLVYQLEYGRLPPMICAVAMLEIRGAIRNDPVYDDDD